MNYDSIQRASLCDAFFLIMKNTHEKESREEEDREGHRASTEGLARIYWDWLMLKILLLVSILRNATFCTESNVIRLHFILILLALWRVPNRITWCNLWSHSYLHMYRKQCTNLHMQVCSSPTWVSSKLITPNYSWVICRPARARSNSFVRSNFSSRFPQNGLIVY